MSSSDLPLISICIPTYKRGEILHYCLDSILAQTYQNLEVIVAENASGDETVDVLKTYQEKDARVRWFVNPATVTAFENHNLVLAEARGEYVLLVHSDDELVPHAVETHLRHLTQTPDAQFSFSAQLWRDFSERLLDGSRGEVKAIRDDNGKVLYTEHIWGDTYKKIYGQDLKEPRPVDTHEFGHEILRRKLLCILGNPGNFLVRNEFYREMREFKPTFYHDPFDLNIKMGWANVSEWQLRALFLAEKAVYIPEPLLIFKQHVSGGEASITVQTESSVVQLGLKEKLCDIVLVNELLNDPVFEGDPPVDLDIAQDYILHRTNQIVEDYLHGLYRRTPGRVTLQRLRAELRQCLKSRPPAPIPFLVLRAMARLIWGRLRNRRDALLRRGTHRDDDQ